MTIDLQGWTDQQPTALAALVERTATMLGAQYRTPDELRKAAEVQVAEVVARVRGANQSGALKDVNARY